MSVYPSCIKKYFEVYKVDYPTFRDEFVVYAHSGAERCRVTTMKMGFETVQSPVFGRAVLMTVQDKCDLPDDIGRFRTKDLLYLNDANGECIARWGIEEHDIVPILEQIFPSWDMRFRDVHRPVEIDGGLKEAEQRQEIKSWLTLLFMVFGQMSWNVYVMSLENVLTEIFGSRYCLVCVKT